MDVFAKIPGLPEDKLHQKFKLLRDEHYYSGARRIIKEWTKDFNDRDNKIAFEFQTSFHSSFWEFYLHAVFKRIGLQLNENYNRPDFIINGEFGFYVEAIVSEINKISGVPESERTPDDTFSMLEPIKNGEEFSSIIDEAITRHSNSIGLKLKKFTGYTSKKNKWIIGYKDLEWFDKSKPYVIALSSYDQIQYGKEYIYSMFALLYGLYYSPENDTFEKKEHIKKPKTDSNINLNIFNTDEMKDVSAIIFTNVMTLGKLSSLSKSVGPDLAHVLNVRYSTTHPHYRIHEVTQDHPEDLLDGLYIFHNPNAKIKFECKEIKSNHIIEFSFDSIGLGMEGGRAPIVARYCSPTGHIINEQLMAFAASSYNKTIAYYEIK